MGVFLANVCTMWLMEACCPQWIDCNKKSDTWKWQVKQFYKNYLFHTSITLHAKWLLEYQKSLEDLLFGPLLTDLPLDKMAATLADGISRCIFMNEKFCILIETSLKFVPKVPINNNPLLV